MLALYYYIFYYLLVRHWLLRKLFSNFNLHNVLLWICGCFWLTELFDSSCFFKLAMRMGFSSSFVLIQKKKKQEEKIKADVSGATAERSFWCWKKNSLRFTTLKQHFSAPPVHSSAHAPTPRPVFHFLRFLYTPRRFAVGFLFRLRLAFGFACLLFVGDSLLFLSG